MGTDFFNMMPTVSHYPKPLAQPIPMQSASQDLSICVVDDDLSMLKAIERLLHSEGLKVEKFSHPAAFLATIGRGSCKVAILDVWMPDMNGLEVQTTMRQTSPQTRVIFISGRDDASVRQAALDAGAFGFLAKPFDDESLLQLVRQAALT